MTSTGTAARTLSGLSSSAALSPSDRDEFLTAPLSYGEGQILFEKPPAGLRVKVSAKDALKAFADGGVDAGESKKHPVDVRLALLTDASTGAKTPRHKGLPVWLVRLRGVTGYASHSNTPSVVDLIAVVDAATGIELFLSEATPDAPVNTTYADPTAVDPAVGSTAGSR